MASAYRCICEYVNRTNPFEGNNVHFLVEENHFNHGDNLSAENLEKHIAEMFDSSRIVVTCKYCSRLVIIGNDSRIEYYEKNNQTKQRKNHGHSATLKSDDNNNHVLKVQQSHFAKMLKNYPSLEIFWITKNNVYLHRLPTNIEWDALSQRDRIMLTFISDVVWGGGYERFDFAYAAKTLEEADRNFISNWLLNPIFPYT